MKTRNVALVLAVHLVFAGVSRADVASALERISSPDFSGESSRAVVQLQSVLKEKSDSATTVRGHCLQTLMATNDPLVLRHTAAVLASEPNENAVQVLASRLAGETGGPMKSGICVALNALLRSTPDMQLTTRRAALDALNLTMQDRKSSPQVVERAVLAAAAMGPPGFDFLVQLKPQVNGSSIKDVLYTALAETRDVRALGPLTNAVRDSGLRQGLRIQAVHALGGLFSSLKKSGKITDLQSGAYVDALASVLNDQSGDQLFSAALAALGRVVDINLQPQFSAVVSGALNSASAPKREAALQALYAAQTPPDPSLMPLIQCVSDSDPEEAIRADAAAVLAKFAAQEN